MLLAPSMQARPTGISNVETGCSCHAGSPSSDVSVFMTLANDSLVTRARNTLASIFLTHKDCTHLYN